MIVLIVIAAAVVAFSLLPISKELALLEKSRKIAGDLLYSLKNILRDIWKEKKKIPLPILILGILWIANGLYISISALIILSQFTRLGPLAGMFRILGIGWIIIGVTLFNGYVLSRKLAFIAAGLVISLGIAVIAIPPLTQEEYLQREYEIYVQSQQYKQNVIGVKEFTASRLIASGEDKPTKAEIAKERIVAVINILIALGTVSYLMTPRAKKYFGIEGTKSLLLKEDAGDVLRRYR